MLPHSRKRSRHVALMVMVPAATSLLLSGCGPNLVEQGVVYQDVQECSQQNPETTAQCATDYQEAQVQHQNVAPRYTTREECESDFGTERCEAAPQQHASGSFFMPMMMGYLAGQMFSRPNVGQSATGGIPTQPLYKSRDDQSSFRTASNQPVAARSGAVNVRPGNVALRPASIMRSGGFGATAARMAASSSGS
jgi:uncharacterized protein YgiB involved in biofilm formation